MMQFKEDDFEIKVEKADPCTVRWIGECQFREPSKKIDDFFIEVSKDLAGQKVEMDFTGLKYMNSTAAISIINSCKFFHEQNVETVILYDQSLKWQEATFKAFKSLSKEITSLSVQAR